MAHRDRVGENQDAERDFIRYVVRASAKQAPENDYLAPASSCPPRSSSLRKESTAMAPLRGRTAIVTGASSGVGKATVKALISEGARVIGVARGEAGLAALGADVSQGLETVRADSSEPGLAERLLRETRPDLVVVVGGVRPKMAPIDEQSWEEFSETWNSDTKTAFHFCKGAVTLPLRPGSTLVLVSSGAAVNGSHLSGGYAGAKRMQWWLAGYAQQRSDRKQLGLRFMSVVPKQLIEGTPIAAGASAAYGAWLGTTGAEFMKRYEVPLDVNKVAAAIVAGLRGDVEAGVTAIGVTGKGVEPIA
jgi:NAD(P)-dependent dehydrogenase (short-subunit alcohol dehydrogenase family)